MFHGHCTTPGENGVEWMRDPLLDTTNNQCNIFHSNLLQIIIVFCPSAQTQINFLIKQLGLGILFAATLPNKIHTGGIVYITPFVLVIKSYLFAILILNFRSRCHSALARSLSLSLVLTTLSFVVERCWAKSLIDFSCSLVLCFYKRNYT